MSDSFNKNSHYTINSPDIAFEVIEDEAVVLNLKKGLYYSLNQSATFIWNLLKEGHTPQKIEDALAAEFGKSASLINESIKFISDLEQENLIISDLTSATTKTSSELIILKNKFSSSPNLKKYSDLEDLLLLDPIHDVDSTGWPEKK